MKREPGFYYRDCSVCQAFMMDESGKVTLDQLKRPVKRPRLVRPLCRTANGCPKGTPENPLTLTQRNQLAYQFHKRCRATSMWPHDELVLDHAALIEEIEEIIRTERDTERSMMQANSVLAAFAGG